MKKGIKTYLTLFLSTLEISAFTFGGGFVIIPMLKRKFTDTPHWIEEDEMLDLVILRIFRPNQIWVMIGAEIASAILYSVI